MKTNHFYRRFDQSITTPYSEISVRRRAPDYGMEQRDGWWVVIGTVEDDDNDDKSVLTVAASDEATAVIAFEDWLCETRFVSLDENSDDYAEIYVDLVIYTGSSKPDITTCNTGGV